MSTTTNGTHTKRVYVRRPDPATLRAWALQHGYNLGSAGRIPEHIMEHYLRVHRTMAKARAARGY